MKSILQLKALLFTLLLYCSAISATVPSLINYQGTLVDAQGQAITTGTKRLTFNIYDSVTEGTLIWGPQVFATVPVINGMFNVILGSTDTTGRLIADAFSEQNRYLGIAVDDGVEITPRQQVLSTPFAMTAQYAIHGDPVGSIQAYFGGSAPEGWVVCDGRSLSDVSLSDNKYDNLKNHMIAWGMSSLPDLRSRTVIGAGQGVGLSNYPLNSSGGEEVHSLTQAEMPTHQHRLNKASYYQQPSSSFGTSVHDVDIGQGYTETDPAGGNMPHNNMPPYRALNYIIKY